MHISATFREALKKAYDELTKNGGKLNIGTFLKFMLEYKPLMCELHEEWYAIIILARCDLKYMSAICNFCAVYTTFYITKNLLGSI